MYTGIQFVALDSWSAFELQLGSARYSPDILMINEFP
jgi:hypothetical protein